MINVKYFLYRAKIDLILLKSDIDIKNADSILNIENRKGNMERIVEQFNTHKRKIDHNKKNSKLNQLRNYKKKFYKPKGCCLGSKAKKNHHNTIIFKKIKLFYVMYGYKY